MGDIKKNKILVSTSTFAEVDPLPLEKLRSSGCEVTTNPYKRKLTKDELLGLLGKDVVGLIAGLETLDREVMKRSGLKVISRCGSGLSNVDLKAARELGVEVLSTPSAPVTAVAEVTVGALISIMRSLPRMSKAMREHKWQKHIGAQLEGKKVAIIGFGRIGRKVGRILRSFGAIVVAVDPALSGSVDDTPIISLEDALRQADIVTLHSSGDKKLFRDFEFSIMKKGAYLLNAARGELIDEGALIKAIEGKMLAGVWLDTFSQEPYSGRLCSFEETMLTPHIGSYTSECRRAMELEAAENLLAALKKGT